MIELKSGDVFASKNPQSLGRMINCIQRIKSHDNQSEYGHTGIIIQDDGATIEALPDGIHVSTLDAYKGSKVLIARFNKMTPEAYQKGFDSIKGHIWHTYPYYRLLMHFLGLGKFIHFSTPVCSELTQKFLINCGMTTITGTNYWGINPDDLVDEWRISDHVEVIFEGIIA